MATLGASRIRLSWLNLTHLSQFALNLATVLGIMVVVQLLVRAVLPGQVASRPMGRVSVLAMGFLFCGLALLRVFFPEAWVASLIDLRRAQWLAQLSAVCLSCLVVIGLCTRPIAEIRGRHRLGVLFLLMPPLLLLETQWGVLTNIHALSRYGLLTLIYGPVVALGAIGGGALFLLKRPASRRRRLLAISSAFFATMLMSVFLYRLPVITTRIIATTIDLRLPPQPEMYTVYLLSLCFWVYAVVALGLGTFYERSRGLGILLIGLSGCQSRTLHQMLFYLTGLLCVAENLLAQAPHQIRRLRRNPDSATANVPSSAA